MALKPVPAICTGWPARITLEGKVPEIWIGTVSSFCSGKYVTGPAPGCPTQVSTVGFTHWLLTADTASVAHSLKSPHWPLRANAESLLNATAVKASCATRAPCRVL